MLPRQSCATLQDASTTNPRFIQRRRARSWIASEGSSIRVEPPMPAGAESSGRRVGFMFGAHNNRVYWDVKSTNRGRDMQLEIDESERRKLIALVQEEFQ